MNWHKAFVPGNHIEANVVAKYLQSKGMFVQIQDGAIRRVAVNHPDHKVWIKDPNLPVGLTVVTFVQHMGITPRMILDLRHLCSALTGIGSYTRLPFPKDKPIHPPATAPSLS